MPEAPEKNLALDIVRITEAAALSSARWLGRGNKEAGDGAAVDAMRNSFSTLHVDGIVVIGEGEKDHAPMLYNGEKVGMGDGPQLDVAVDPVEGTSLLAYGRPNAISTVAVAPRGSMFNPGPSYYMQKLVVAREARDVIDLDAPVDVNLHNVARALGKNVQDLVVFVLDKPRHKKLIEDIRSTGARIQLHTDGDVAGALMAVDPRSEVDVMMGTGGTPEGVLAACAIKGMGGQILARLDPQSYVEKEAINEAGIDIREVLTVHDLVRSDDCFFAATGISGGDFLRGVRYSARHAVTHSLVLRGKTDYVPRVVYFRMDFENPLATAMLANSITLTPGTITLSVSEDGIFGVHAITEACAADVLSGKMQRRVAKLYGETCEFEAMPECTLIAVSERTADSASAFSALKSHLRKGDPVHVHG